VFPCAPTIQTSDEPAPQTSLRPALVEIGACDQVHPSQWNAKPLPSLCWAVLRQPTAQTSSGPDDQTPPNSAVLVSVGKKLSTHQLPLIVPAQATGTAHPVELGAGTCIVRPGGRGPLPRASAVGVGAPPVVTADEIEASVLPEPHALQPSTSVTNSQPRRGFHEPIP